MLKAVSRRTCQAKGVADFIYNAARSNREVSRYKRTLNISISMMECAPNFQQIITVTHRVRLTLPQARDFVRPNQ